MAQKEPETTISWIALMLGALALIIALLAYNRSGADVTRTIKQQSTEISQETEVAAARAKARAQLIALRTRLEAEESADEIANEVRDIRMDLQTAYTNTQMEAEDDYKELDSALENLERDVRQGSANALASLASLIDSLGREIRYDN